MSFRRAFVSVCVFACIAGYAGVSYAYISVSLNTVFSQLEQMYQLPPGILGKIANAESGGNATICASSSSACGIFQWTDASWYEITKKVRGTALNLSARSIPTVAAKMTAIALKDAENKYGSLIQANNINMITGLYMCHFLGEGGCGKFFQLYAQDPNAIASSYFPREARSNPTIFNGRTLAGVLALMDQKMQVTGSTVNYAGNFVDQNGISLAYSNADVSMSDYMPANFVPPAADTTYDYPTNYAQLGTGGTQGLASPVQLPQPMMQPYSYPQQPVAPQQIQQPLPQGPSPAQQQAVQAAESGSLAGGTQTVGAPVALIIAQPSSAYQGDPVVVSWVSANVSASGSCQISDAGTLVAQGTEGTKILTTLPAGSNTLKLQCAGSNGQTIRQSVSVSVQ